MSKLTIYSDKLLLNGERDYLIGADIHYFRIDPQYWRDRVQKALDLGCNVVSVYIPWSAHEVEAGLYDFTGETHSRRNVVRFLELLWEMDVSVIAKPGPFVYSELPGQGVPTWWVASHPEARAKYWDGKQFKCYKEDETANLSYLHPDYLAAADVWLSRILEIIGPFQRCNGGTIDAVQTCNEISGQQVWLGGYDMNPEGIQFGNQDGLYARFFEAKYGDIERLNRVHATNYFDFSEVPLPLGGPCAKDETCEILASDYAEFYWKSYIPTYTSWLVERFRTYGIQEQLVTNIAFPEMVVQMREALERNSDLFAGIDLYYTFIHNNILGPRNIAYCCEYGPQILANITKQPPVSLEFQAGAPNELEYQLYEPYTYIWALWSLVGGYQGLNLYVLAGGNNLPRAGKEGATYNYQAPVTPDGELRDTYYGFQRAFSEAQNMDWLLDSELCADITIAICDQAPFRDNSIRSICEGLFRTNYAADVMLLDEASVDDLLSCKVVWFSSEKRLGRDYQEKLADYVMQGGSLILSGEMPVMGYDYHPSTHLMDRLGFEVGDIEENSRMLLFNGLETGASAYRAVDVKSKQVDTIASLEDGRPSVVSFNAGEGRVVVVPFEVGFSTSRQLDLFKAVLDAAEVNPVASAQRARVLVRKLPDGSRKWFALNYHPIPLDEEIVVAGKSHRVEMAPFSISWGDA